MSDERQRKHDASDPERRPSTERESERRESSISRRPDSVERMLRGSSAVIDDERPEPRQRGEGLRPRPTSTPKTIGHYRILEKLGEGGMGLVFAAEQDSPRRRVAVKLLRTAFASESAYRRFAVESEILARLTHPGIAQVYEAGVSELEDGSRLPFIAMECIDGPPITTFVERERLSLKDRVRLFQSVLDAIEFAHRKGVIHRDLKPLNVLVDATRHPKILDFGVARILDAEDSNHTRAGTIVGTVEAMSPEHAAGQPADTRSDVFALGCILYELLTGKRPRDLRHLGFTTSLRVVRDEPIPSIRTVTSGLPEDLAAIVDHALEPDPERRYASAAAFAEDLRRWQRGEPILARPATALYRTRRFVARHRLACVFGGFALLTLILGGITSWILWRRAERDRVAVSRAREIERSIHEYILGDMLRTPSGLENGRSLRVADVLDRAAAGIAKRFGDQPAIESEARFALAQYYRDIGSNELALEQATATVARRSEIFGATASTTLEAQVLVGEMLSLLGRNEDALALFDRVIDLLSSAVERSIDAETVLQTARLGRANMLNEIGQFPEAEVLLRDVAAVRERIHGREDRRTLTARANLSVTLGRQGKFVEAEAIQREVLDAFSRTLSQDDPQYLATVQNLARLLEDQRKLADAEKVWRDLLASATRVEASDRRLAFYARIGLATALRESEHSIDECRQLLDESVELANREFGPNHLDTLRALRERARFAVANEDPATAVERARAVVERFESSGRTDLPEFGGSLATLGNALSAAKDEPAALAAYRRALDLARRDFPGNTPQLAEALYNVSTSLRRSGDLAGAATLMRETIAVDMALYGQEHVTVLEDQVALARMELEAGHPDLAEQAALAAQRIEAAIGTRTEATGDSVPPAKSALLALTLGRARVGLNRDADAEECLGRAFEAFRTVGSQSNFELARQEYAALVERIGRDHEARRIRETERAKK